MLKTLKYGISILAVLVVFGIVGGMDAESEEQERQYYCDMVKDGYWPNYKNISCE